MQKYDVVTKILRSVGVTLTKDDLELRQKPLLKRCMQKWLPAHDALLEMIVQHLPSPGPAPGSGTRAAIASSRTRSGRLASLLR